MTYYQKHIFFCCNQRDSDRKCCAQANAMAMYAYAKDRLKELELYGVGKIRVSTSGCLGRCPLGPVLVIYPEGTWYTYANQQDIDEIIESHLIHEKPVARLLIEQGDGTS